MGISIHKSPRAGKALLVLGMILQQILLESSAAPTLALRSMHNKLRAGCTHKKFHLRDLFIHLLHKLYYEVHQLVLQHLLRMHIRNQERNIITL